jgi:peptidoglycan/xylan/chitin deacetylase (PgdA/CDA1 family)
LKKAYLTIDDGPSRDFTAKMEFLHRHGIPALFFCEGRFIQQREDAVRAAIERGFLIGNHSFNHPHFSDIPLEACKQEILRTDQLIEHIYHSMSLEWPARYFRFPYLDRGGNEKHTELQVYLQTLGYRQPNFDGIHLEYFDDPHLLTGMDVGCTYDQAEYWLHEADAPWGLSTEAAILARIEEDFPYAGRSLNCETTVDIVLVHDHEKTSDLFYRIIERYIEKGIQFLPIPTTS